MDQQYVDSFILTNNNFFRSYQLPIVRKLLENADNTKWIRIQTIQFKDPTLALVLSILVGYLGIDRFYVGDIGLGIIKLLTGGGLGIWTVIDWFLIMGIARDKNVDKLQMSLY